MTSRAEHAELVELVADAGACFVATVVGLGPRDWDRPGLGEWTVRELVGHTMRAFTTIERFLDNPRAAVDVSSPADYYRMALGSAPDVHSQVAARGREAGIALGDDPVTAVVEGVSAVVGRLGETDGSEVGLTAVGAMMLTNYLDTRLVELVVHLSDLCHAVGRATPDLGGAGVRAAATVFSSATDEDRDTVIRAMLGRATLPAGFNVWP